MKKILLTINHVYLFFGTTVYVGVLWGLHFFWYPSWKTIKLENVHDHFIIPTSEATEFFTIVVPLMFLANIIMIVKEWNTKFRWSSILALLCISGATYVGQIHIIPINETINAGVDSMATLRDLFQDWMFLNDLRWVIMTIMWLTLIYYFVDKGDLMERFANGKSSSNYEQEGD